MTAHALVEERQRCLDAGMNDHVTKPIEPDALFATLKRWAKPRRRRPPAPPLQKPSSADARDRAAGNRGHRRGGRIEARRREQAAVPQPARAVRGEAGGCRRANRGRAARAGTAALAGRFAHTVKGVAGNLGIASVQAAAGRVERAIRENGEPAGVIRELEAALGCAVDEIRHGLVSETPATVETPEEFDPLTAAAGIGQLSKLIEANDGDAVNALPAVEHALAGVVDRSQLDALRDALDEFDFEQAGAKLAEIAGQCALLRS